MIDTLSAYSRRKILPIIYVIDCSGSMVYERMGSVNASMYEAVDSMRELSSHSPDSEIQLGILCFSSGAEWTTKNASGKEALINVNDYTWEDLHAGGLTDLGAALDKLNQCMSRKCLFNDPVGYRAPVIIFVSDGFPTDDWSNSLARINSENKWFRLAMKLSVAVGEAADKDALAMIAGKDGQPCAEAVIEVSEMGKLGKAIREVTVAASQIASASRSINNAQARVRILDTLQDEVPNSIQADAISAKSWSAVTSDELLEQWSHSLDDELDIDWNEEWD